MGLADFLAARGVGMGLRALLCVAGPGVLIPSIASCSITELFANSPSSMLKEGRLASVWVGEKGKVMSSLLTMGDADWLAPTMGAIKTKPENLGNASGTPRSTRLKPFKEVPICPADVRCSGNKMLSWFKVTTPASTSSCKPHVSLERYEMRKPTLPVLWSV